MNPRIAEALERPHVRSWARLRDPETASSIRAGAGRTLLVDGPFIESKEYLGGLITIDADNLDQALAIAEELQAARTGGAIELRPALD